MNSPKIDEKQILQNLETSFEEVFSQDKEARHSLLKEMGYDPDKYVAQGLEHVKRLAAQQKLNLMGRLWERANELIANYSGKFQGISGDQLKARLEQVFTGDRAAFQFRDFNEPCDNDLRIILEDAGILDELNNLEEME